MPTEKIYKKVKKLPKEEEQEVNKTPAPNKEEQVIGAYIAKRVKSMKDFRKTAAMGKDLESIWKKADADYAPQELTEGDKGKRFETDEDLGLRTRLVPIGASAKKWRNKNSEPTLLVKIQTALSIIIDRDPEGSFQAGNKKYEATTKLAYELWKSSWLLDQSKNQLKLFCFNLAKYGWAVGRSYPKIIKRNKSILTEIDTENPENNKYEEKTIVDYNGLHRENLDPYKTWIDEMAQPNDALSVNDWYFEKDYNYDSAELEFGNYPKWQFVQKGLRGSDEDTDKTDKSRKDLITIGFYENKNKDLYAIYIPAQKMVLYSSPLPNDNGKLSLWHTYWILRDARSPYGIGLYELIKQKKSLYDKMMNMTLDQLVLSIYKMFFYSGTNSLIGDGTIEIEPGKGVQNLGGKVDFLDVPGPGKDSFDGLQMLKSGIDDDTGISPTIEGEITGKTLGEVLTAKESALKRFNVPLNNVSDAITQEAYISLAWLAQLYSTPEVMEFVDEEDLMKYEAETGKNSFEMNQNIETGQVTASYLPEVPLNLDFAKDSNDLIESKERRFFQIGKDIHPDQLRWEGIVFIKPRSILVPSVEIEKQRKQEMFNLIMPVLPLPPEIYAKPVSQLLKVNEEDLEDWLPDTWIQFLETGKLPQPAQPLFMNPEEEGGGETMKGQQGMSGGGMPTVVPKGEVSAPDMGQMMGGLGKMMQAQ